VDALDRSKSRVFSDRVPDLASDLNMRCRRFGTICQAPGRHGLRHCRGEVPAPFSHTEPQGRGVNEFLGELEVWFAENRDAVSQVRPSSVRLTLAEGIAPTALWRFAWSKMLAIADTEVRIGVEDTRTSLGWRGRAPVSLMAPLPERAVDSPLPGARLPVGPRHPPRSSG